MFETVAGIVVLAEWATRGDIAKAMCAQLSVRYEPDGIFTAKEGRVRYVILDGLVGHGTVAAILDQLPWRIRSSTSGATPDRPGGRGGTARGSQRLAVDEDPRGRARHLPAPGRQELSVHASCADAGGKQQMSDIQVNEDLLSGIGHRLELREPNYEAVKSVAAMTSMHFDVDGKAAPFECIVDSATGVGKTYVMAGLIEYFAGLETPARNFLLLAPGRTIREQEHQELQPGASQVPGRRDGVRAVPHHGRQFQEPGNAESDGGQQPDEAVHLHRAGPDLEDR